MKHLRIIIFLSIFSTISNTQALATIIKVKKTKGLSAIIESSLPLEEGVTYTLEVDKLTEDPNFSKNTNQRKNSLSIGGQFSFLKGTNTQENRFQIEGRYGWTSVNYDYGPALFFNTYDLGAGFNTEFYVGSFFDYNLTPHRSQDSFYIGLTSQLMAGNLNYSTGASSQIYKLDAGCFFNWFIIRNSTALRLEGLYEIKRVNSSVATTDITGFLGKLFVVFYY